MTDIIAIQRRLERKLTPCRYRHSLCVRRRAMKLAVAHGVDWYSAGVAGLVHDVCHCEEPETLLCYLREHGMEPDALTMEHPQLWHAMAGAVYVREELGIRAPGVIRAVRYHTTGRARMTPLEQVVYLADLTSDDRDFPDVEHVRALSDRSLALGMRYAFQYIVKRLLAEEKTIVKDCVDGYNEYIRIKADMM